MEIFSTGMGYAAPFVDSFFRRAVHDFIWQNYNEPGGNLLKDQAILDFKQCYLNISYVRQFFLVQTIKCLIWTNKHETKELKNGSC